MFLLCNEIPRFASAELLALLLFTSLILLFSHFIHKLLGVFFNSLRMGSNLFHSLHFPLAIGNIISRSFLLGIISLLLLRFIPPLTAVLTHKTTLSISLIRCCYFRRLIRHANLWIMFTHYNVLEQGGLFLLCNLLIFLPHILPFCFL